ncbi:MAG: CotH kinase family protein, partial [Fibromonadales bacterium]|nr:CotH kinase family protein [Fibromonadales bacterium]
MKKALLLLPFVFLFSCSDSEIPPLYEPGGQNGGEPGISSSGPSNPNNSSSSGAPGSSGSSSSSSSDDWEPGYVEQNTVYFNEVHVANNDYKDEFGNDPGWVEFYNPNNVEVRLRDFVLTNNADNPLWTFGDVRIEPLTYFVVFLSGNNRPTIVPPNGNLHASFELRNSGNLFLLDAQGNRRDSVAYKAGTKDLSWAKKNGSTPAEWSFSKPSTPKALNSNETYAEIAPPPTDDVLPPSGFYTPGYSFTMPENIYCERTRESPTDNSPIKPGNVIVLDTNSMLYCAQLNPGAGIYPSDPIMRTYIISSKIGGARRPSLPIVSIAAPSNFKSIYDGISQNSGDFEMLIHVDFFESNVVHQWSHPAELGPMGSASRAWPKKPVRVSFREKYGVKNIQYRLFPDDPPPKDLKYKHFVLRNNGNNWENDYIRDMLMTSLTEGLDIDYQKGRAVIVYYNGRYYGIHNLRERSNSDYFETNYKINENYINLVKIVDPTVNSSGLEVSRGSAADYQSILTWLNSITTLSNADLETLKERIDVDNFTNHFQSRIFYNDRDWPGKNVKVWNTTNSASTKWRF